MRLFLLLSNFFFYQPFIDIYFSCKWQKPPNYKLNMSLLLNLIKLLFEKSISLHKHDQFSRMKGLIDKKRKPPYIVSEYWYLHFLAVLTKFYTFYFKIFCSKMRKSADERKTFISIFTYYLSVSIPCILYIYIQTSSLTKGQGIVCLTPLSSKFQLHLLITGGKSDQLEAPCNQIYWKKI